MRASAPNAPSTAPSRVRMSVTYTGTPAARRASRSSGRFSSWLATTRSGASATIAATSGFFVPRTRVTSRSAGWVHQSVAPTSSARSLSATASVSDGTMLTTRRTRSGVATGRPSSSTITARGYMLRRYWPPTSKNASVIWPSEHTRAASISSSNTLPSPVATSCRRRSAAGASAAWRAWKSASRSSWLCFSSSVARASSISCGEASDCGPQEGVDADDRQRAVVLARARRASTRPGSCRAGSRSPSRRARRRARRCARTRRAPPPRPGRSAPR